MAPEWEEVEQEEEEEGAKIKPLSRVERFSWICYDLATNAYSSSAITFFMPLLATTLASEYAWKSNTPFGGAPPKCSTGSRLNSSGTTVCTECEPGSGTVLVLNGTKQLRTGSSEIGGYDLDVQAGIAEIDPVAYATFCISMSILLQLVLYIIIGPTGDYGSARRVLLTVATVAGASLTFACGFVTKPSLYWLVGLFLVLSNAAAGLAFVAYNSWLPLLVDADDRVRLLNEHNSTELQRREARLLVGNELSSHGYAIGYIGGVITLAISLALSSIDALSEVKYFGATLMLAGAWWLFFGLLCIAGLVSSRSLKRASSPADVSTTPLSAEAEKQDMSSACWKKKYRFPCTAKECFRPMMTGLTELIDTIRKAHRRKHIFVFLVLYFFYSDGYSTISSVGILFAQRDVCMDAQELGILALVVPLAAFFGNFAFLWLHKRCIMTSKGILVTNLMILAFLGIYAQLGWLTNTHIGLKSAVEMYGFGVIYGTQLGSVQSFSRTIFGDMVPQGSEAQFFSLFQITDKGSSWLGPLVVSSIVQATGSLRLSLAYLVVSIVMPAILVMRFVDHESGMIEAGRTWKLQGVAQTSD